MTARCTRPSRISGRKEATTYRIGTIAALVGVPRNTLLAWERRYQLLNPARSERGHRLYTDADVEVLRRVKALLDQGLRIGEAVATIRRAGGDLIGEAPQSTEELSEVSEALEEALLRFDRSRADALRRRLVLLSFRQALDDIYLPTLRRVGERWHAGEIGVAQEHFVSAFIREQVVTMLHSLEGGPEDGERALCACYPGEQHEIGILAVAVKLALRGWRITYLGADLPLEDLLFVAGRTRPALLCQSIVHRRPPEELRAHRRALRKGVAEDTLVVLGGPGVEGLPEEVEGVWCCPRIEDLLARLEART